MPELGTVLSFMRALWALDHAFQSVSKRMEAALGVTSPQRLVVRIVGRFPRISAGETAAILHLHPSTLTGVLKRLEERGFISHRPDPTDARRALFELTAKGRALDAVRTPTVEAAVRRMLRRLKAGDADTARAAVEALTAELEQLRVGR